MKKAYKNIIIILIVVVCFIFALYVNGTVGSLEYNIESDARKWQGIDDNWEVSKSVLYPVGAMLFYDAESNASIYSIYLNRRGFSFGYFFRSGGSRSEINEGICEFYFREYGTALISRNTEKIKLIETDDGQNINTISIDSEKPFAVVLPNNCGKVTVYDINNNEVPISSVVVNE